MWFEKSQVKSSYHSLLLNCIRLKEGISSAEITKINPKPLQGHLELNSIFLFNNVE